MTDIRAKGFSSNGGLREELAEFEQAHDLHHAADLSSEEPVTDANLREVAWLRKEAADMRERLVIAQQRRERSDRAKQSLSTITIGAAFGATLFFGVVLRQARSASYPFQRDRIA